jgi:hypothetical protein
MSDLQIQILGYLNKNPATSINMFKNIVRGQALKWVSFLKLNTTLEFLSLNFWAFYFFKQNVYIFVQNRDRTLTILFFFLQHVVSLLQNGAFYIIQKLFLFISFKFYFCASFSVNNYFFVSQIYRRRIEETILITTLTKTSENRFLFFFFTVLSLFFTRSFIEVMRERGLGPVTEKNER